jgi:hypothetical protein
MDGLHVLQKKKTEFMKKKVIYIIIALAIVLVLYFVFKKKKANKTAEGSGTDTSVFPLRMGSQGREVKQLQSYLIKEFGPSELAQWGVDGVWGSETNAAVEKNLKRNSISMDYFLKTGMNLLPA